MKEKMTCNINTGQNRLCDNQNREPSPKKEPFHLEDKMILSLKTCNNRAAEYPRQKSKDSK